MLSVWLIFTAFVLALLALDLGVFHREARVLGTREALGWSSLWIAVSLAFSVFVYFGYESHWLGLGQHIDAIDGRVNSGATATEKYLTGYVIEKSLSVDNIFVIATIFNFLAIPQKYQHRVLFWGILGALVLRGVMIGLGTRLIAEFHWVLYLFAVFLILTGLRMLTHKPESYDLENSALVRVIRRFFAVSTRLHGQRFFVRSGQPGTEDDAAMRAAPPGTLFLTPLALALLLVEVSDVIFAVDSIPAIFAITADPFLVYTSNVFAILGLRSLYFVLADMAHRFRHLDVALALVLLVVGVKMLLAEWLKLALGRHFNLYLLIVVIGIIAGGILLSIWKDRRRGRQP